MSGGFNPRFYTEASLDAAGYIETVNLRVQADVARFANLWAGNIKAQGWLGGGKRNA